MSAIRPDPQQWRDLLLREIVLPSLVDQVPTEQARGRELAAAVRSPEAMPAVPIAALDGFAGRRTALVAPGRPT
ncbi:MAG: molybdopterin molybdenumtransferase MoeA, partial [Brachybacterium sp.]|nr:molybdopterin molybdenumtransferase MoeA [Brachybacterium sp.]